jgi:S1-C subfamily serine protease
MPGNVGGQILGGQILGGGGGAGLGPMGQNAEEEKSEGFLGVCLAMDDEQSAIEPNIGATVEGRIPGLVAYRMLCDGDVIDSIMVPGVDSVPRFLADHEKLHDAVSGLQPGRVVVLGVMRGGRHLQIKLALDSKTDEMLREERTRVGPEELIGERLDKGLATWEQQFAPIVDGEDGGSGSARAD